MGHTSYSVNSRSARLTHTAETTGLNFMSIASADAFVADKAFNTFFTQQKEGKLHESMSPFNLKFRECFDSEAHPNTVAILLGLDVTASMGKVPKEFIMEGLPTMMSKIIQRGTPDAAVCFAGIGDHVFDDAPIQIGQFESGDAELDQWLTRTWLEKGGGSNDGESYSLLWYIAARHTKIDCCSKRNKKGFLFTVGDEPVLPSIPASTIKGIFGDNEGIQSSVSTAEILKEAQECYNVYHLALTKRGEAYWKQLLGQNYVVCDDYRKIPELIADIVYEHQDTISGSVSNTVSPSISPEDKITL